MTNHKRRRFFRPRFTLAALLVLITAIAIPLGYVAQRRAWNEQRLAVFEQLTARQFQIAFEDPRTSATLVRARNPVEQRGYVANAWAQLCLEDHSPRILLFSSAQWTHSQRESKPQLTDAELKLLTDYFPEVKYLHLFIEPKITDKGLAYLRSLTKLETLSLYQLEQVSGEFLGRLPADNSIRNLEFNELPQLEGRELVGLSKLSKLQDLSLRLNPSLSDDTLQGVRLPASLTSLSLEADTAFDVTLSRWLGQLQLEKLTLDAGVGRSVAPALARQTQLQHLQIMNAPFIDADFAFLARCNGLNDLSLECMPIQGRFLAHLAQPKELRRLSFRATLLNDDSLPALASFLNLESMRFEWTPIQGEEFSEALRWPKLKGLSVMGCQFSDKGKEAFARISGLTDVVLPDNWSAEDMERFPPSNKPKTAILSYSQGSGSSIPTLPPHAGGIMELRIDRCPVEVMQPVMPLLERGRILEERCDREEKAR